MRTITILFGTAAVIASAATASAQSVDERITRQDGTVRMSFSPRTGVCGDGGATIYTTETGSSRRTIHVRGNRFSNTTTDRYSDEWEPHCVPGPARVAVTVEYGKLTSLRTYVGGEWPAGSSARDIGRVRADEAARVLLRLAERSSGQAAGDALFAATLADSADTAPALLRLARNQQVEASVRKSAVFYLGNAAAEVATRGLRDIASDGDEEISVRESAVFALTRLSPDVGVPSLIDLVRNSTEPRIRKSAIFWLARSEDPRAIKLFEEILLTRK